MKNKRLAWLRLAAFLVLPALVLAGCDIRSAQPGPPTKTGIDRTAPSIVSRSPADGATGVTVSTTIEVGFSEALDPGSVGNSSVTLSDGSNDISGSVALASNNSTIVFTPGADLEGETTYTVTVSGTVSDVAGNELGGSDSWSFMTVDSTAPAISARSPAPDATGVAVGTTVTVTFSEALAPASVDDTSITLSDGANDVSGTVTLSSGDTTIVFTPDADLEGDTTYSVTVSSSVTDIAGNTLGADDSWSFSTGDSTAPTITSRSPAADAGNVPVTTTIEVTFSEALDPASVLANAIVVTDSGGSVAGTISLSTNDTIVVFTPDADLTPGMLHSVTVSGAIADLAGNTLGADDNWSFTTLSAGPISGRIAYSSYGIAPTLDTIRIVDINAAGIVSRTDPAVNGANDDFYFWGTDEFALSPDGSKIAYIAYRTSDGENALHIQNLETGVDFEVDIGDIARFEPMQWIPVWSPDSSKLLFIVEDRQSGVTLRATLFMVAADGTGLIRLTPEGYYINGAAYGWSPDGTYAHAGVIEAATSDHFHGVVDPADGELVASCGMGVDYYSQQEQFRWGPGSDAIYCANVTEFYWSPVPGNESLLFTTGSQPLFFEVSPDGNSLAWTGTSPDSTVADYELWTANLPCLKGTTSCGSPYLQLSNFGDNGDSRGELVWSPDGSKIAYLGSNLPAGVTGLFYVPADGSTAPVELGDNSAYPNGTARSYTTSMRNVREPSLQWTPDSTRIVFMGRLERDRTDAFIVNIAQPTTQVVLSDQTVETQAVFVGFVPGSDKVVYGNRSTGVNGTVISTIDTDGTNRVQISENSTGADPKIDDPRAVYLQSADGLAGPFEGNT